MNKLDDFFNKHLTNYTEAEDGWNIPSEDIWNKASQHFSKEEKKKRSLIWWFFGLGIMLGFVSAYFLFSESQSFQGNNQPVVSLNENIIQSDVKENNGANENNEITENIALSENKLIEIQNESITQNTNQKIKSEKIIKVVQSNKTDDNGNNLTTIYTLNPSTRSSAKQVSDKQNTLDNIVTENKLHIQVNEMAKELNESGSSINGRNRALLSSPVIAGSVAAVKSSSKTWVTNNFSFAKPTEIIKGIKRPKKEFGLGRTSYLVLLLDFVELKEDPRDEFSLDTKTANINMNMRYWYKPRWSVQTGVYLAKLNANLDFSVFRVLEEDEIEDFSNLIFNELVEQSGISDRNSWETDLNFEDTEIMVGDEINVKGNVDIELQAIQLPIIINFHWYKKRLDYFIGAGPTVEYIWNTQIANDYQINSNGKEYSVNFIDNEIMDTYFDYSIYLNGGMQYKITKSINLEMALKISILEFVFSGLDIGINYRWNT